MKSHSPLISNVDMSGFETSTLGFPPNLGNLASISPKALETYFDYSNTDSIINTDSLPGVILNGTGILKGESASSFLLLFAAAWFLLNVNKKILYFCTGILSLQLPLFFFAHLYHTAYDLLS